MIFQLKPDILPRICLRRVGSCWLEYYALSIPPAHRLILTGQEYGQPREAATPPENVEAAPAPHLRKRRPESVHMAKG